MDTHTSRGHASAGRLQTGARMGGNRLISGVVCLMLLGMPGRGQAQGRAPAPPLRPEFRWLLDAPLLATGGALLLVSGSMLVTRKFVPPEGLDPKAIRWSVDRNVVGNADTRADKESDYYRDAVWAYPVILAFASQPSGTRIDGTLRRALVYSETILMAEGIASILKNLTDRPRPFNYLPIDERPDDPAFDVTSNQAFRSMPSGHATSGFTGAAFAITDHLISRPNAGWGERLAVSSFGGFLAGMTGTLRIKGGQHFPSDVLVGGLIGTVSGVTVPLLHHYLTPEGEKVGLPPAHAWWQALAGEVGGIGLGILVAQVAY